MATTRNIQMQYYNGTDYDTLYPQVNLSNISGSISINNISGNLPATRVSYSNSSTSSIITGNNVQLAIDQLFQSVSNGKSQIASAITDKGVSTSSSASFSTMASNIRRIETGTYFHSWEGDMTIGNLEIDSTYGTTTPSGDSYRHNFQYGDYGYTMLWAFFGLDGGNGNFVEAMLFDSSHSYYSGEYANYSMSTSSGELGVTFTFKKNPEGIKTNSLFWSNSLVVYLSN